MRQQPKYNLMSASKKQRNVTSVVAQTAMEWKPMQEENYHKAKTTSQKSLYALNTLDYIRTTHNQNKAQKMKKRKLKRREQKRCSSEHKEAIKTVNKVIRIYEYHINYIQRIFVWSIVEFGGSAFSVEEVHGPFFSSAFQT